MRFSHGLPGSDHEVAQSEEDLQLVVVFLQAPVAGLPVSEQVLEDVERVLDECPHRGFRLFHGKQAVLFRPVLHLPDRLAAFRDLPVDLSFRVGGLDLITLVDAHVARVGVDLRFASMKQHGGLGDVRNVRCRGHDGVDQAALAVDPDVRFHPEIPLVAFLRLVHSGVARLVLVLRGGRGVDDGGVHERAFAHEQAALFEVRVDGFEDGCTEVVLLQQPPELEQGGGVGNGIDREVDPEEGAHGLAVVNGIFECFVGQPIPLLEEVKAQHAFKSDGWPASLAVWISGLDRSEKIIPRDDFLHGREELLAPRDLAFSCEFEFRKSLLVFHEKRYRIFTCRRVGLNQRFPNAKPRLNCVRFTNGDFIEKQ